MISTVNKSDQLNKQGQFFRLNMKRIRELSKLTVKVNHFYSNFTKSFLTVGQAKIW
jgi:hypothetical protein